MKTVNSMYKDAKATMQVGDNLSEFFKLTQTGMCYVLVVV